MKETRINSLSKLKTLIINSPEGCINLQKIVLCMEALTGQNHKGTTFVAITDCPNLKSLSCYFWEELRDSAVNAITGAYHHGTEPVSDDSLSKLILVTSLIKKVWTNS